jgi:hypothetical protein
MVALVASERNLTIAAGLCGGLGLGAWGFYARALRGAVGEDWTVYDTAIRAYYEGRLALLYDGAALTGLLNARFGSWFDGPLPLHPWLYPPHYLLLLLPFGLLPPVAAYILFIVLSFAAMAIAVSAFFADWRRRLAAIAMVALCPAAAITVLLGQNSFFTCALLAGGFGLLRRRPVLAGALFGLLTYKPQLCLMVPVALLAERQWKAMAVAAATALGLVLASAAVLGADPWRDWLRVMLTPSPLFTEWTALARLNGQSIYTYAALLGAGPSVANAIQAGAALVAAVAVWVSHRGALEPHRKLAVLLGATMLAAPHVIDYDALMLGLAAILMLLASPDHEWRLGETALPVLVWASPFFNPPSVWALAYATPVLVLALMAFAMRRVFSSSPRKRGPRTSDMPLPLGPRFCGGDD